MGKCIKCEKEIKFIGWPSQNVDEWSKLLKYGEIVEGVMMHFGSVTKLNQVRIKELESPPDISGEDIMCGLVCDKCLDELSGKEIIHPAESWDEAYWGIAEH